MAFCRIQRFFTVGHPSGNQERLFAFDGSQKKSELVLHFWLFQIYTKGLAQQLDGFACIAQLQSIKGCLVDELH